VAGEPNQTTLQVIAERAIIIGRGRTQNVKRSPVRDQLK
jgi:hypothetical protein